jgi:CDP-diacylglycerol--glycerol-3-phosphate 3-phosphatidyltransferase
MAERKSPRQFNTLTDYMRYRTAGLTSAVGRWLHARGVHPDLITFVGLLVVAVAAYLASQGEFFWAAIVIIAGAPLDAVDGAVARAMGRTDKFGALWDSVLDRYADGLLFMALAYYYSKAGNQTAMVLAVLALLGTELVSYARARAEGINVDCKVGLFTRMERMVVILAMLLTGYVIAGLWILAIGTNFTVAQRVWHVYRVIQRQKQEGRP